MRDMGGKNHYLLFCPFCRAAMNTKQGSWALDIILDENAMPY